MKILSYLTIVLALVLHTPFSSASSTRTIDADSITSSDKTKTFSFPASSDALVGITTTNNLQTQINNKAASFTPAQETPAGTINGTNVTFTLAHTPQSAASVHIYLNGLIQKQGAGLDYTISSSTITFAVAPALGQSIYAEYIY